ncbi:histidine kinase/DNA gyrase B/HSP90-like ATPase [Aliiruegeria haliotis]|uniref:Histidine kinase/DNA gyrase B/HSP90-like ATPase n=1 Tax=Aliiruegeria haliotis TaxID=1280846 RepID=A0A2T0RFR7_9RHOB|nr:PocR ligand-binding domain-containing protein [Aliiruegeria haliotis]PRY20054.1 histidine kinase/DNA gyrase B/HSP90-like ATPase [Aliiruegeria haliotis]
MGTDGSDQGAAQSLPLSPPALEPRAPADPDFALMGDDLLAKKARRRKLEDLMSVETLQKIQDNFSTAVGVAMVIVDPKGEPITKPSGFSSFCNAIRKHPEWQQRCFHCDAVGGQAALSTGEPSIYKCHCGLMDFSAPISIRGEYLGAATCGQVKLAPGETMPNLMDLSGLFPTEQAWRENKELLGLFGQTGEITYEQLRAAAYSLHYFASYIVEESYNKTISEELYRNQLKLMEESKLRAELESSLREAELQALSYQVNPHFLFNVLNTIGRLALVEDAEQTESTVHAFADMMRYILRKSGSPFVSLGTELEHVKNYLYLLQVRLGDRFTFKIAFPDEVCDVSCPFMALQPIVENCINYAIEPCESDGLIEISANLTGSDVVVDISDNGEGITHERKMQALAGTAGDGKRRSIGISNIDSRLRHYYGEDHGLEIVSPYRDGKGTLVRLRLPVDFDPGAV